MSDLVLHNNQKLPVKEVAQIFASSGMFPDAKSAAEVATKLIVGRSLGMSDYDSMAGFHIIKGKVNLSANSMAAAIKKSGRYNYRVTEHTKQVCSIEFEAVLEFHLSRCEQTHQLLRRSRCNGIFVERGLREIRTGGEASSAPLVHETMGRNTQYLVSLGVHWRGWVSLHAKLSDRV